MKKWICTLAGLFTLHFVLAQAGTQSLRIYGTVRTERIFSLTDLQKFPVVDLGEVNTSCSSRKKNIVQGVKGVLLKSVMDSVAFAPEQKQRLNALYLRCVAKDGYTVVFSFGELYNSPVGNQLYLVTAQNGSTATHSENSLLLLSLADIKPGSRNIKWLEAIEVCASQ